MSSSTQVLSIEKGQIVRNVQSGKVGVVTGVWFNQWSHQQVINVRVPGASAFVMWSPSQVERATTADAVCKGDMVIATDHSGQRHMGLVTGKTDAGQLIAQFAVGTHTVDMARVWRVVPSMMIRRSNIA